MTITSPHKRTGKGLARSLGVFCELLAVPLIATPQVSSITNIVTNKAPLWTAETAWRLANQPRLTIGQGQQDASELYRVVGALRLQDGRIVIANAGTHEIRFYDPHGVYQSAIGGRGRGPSEFARLAWMQRLGHDSLAIYDASPPRIVVLDDQGELIRSTSLQLGGSFRARSLVGVSPDGSMVMESMPWSAAPAPGVYRPDIALIRYSSDGRHVGLISIFPGHEAFHVRSNGGRTTEIEYWFGRSTRFRVHGDRLFVATNDTYKIQEYSMSGELVRVIAKDHAPAPVLDEDLERLRRPFLEITDANRRKAYAAILRQMPIRSTMPAFGVPMWRSTYPQNPIQLDAAGNLWVREYNRPDDNSSRWSVFAATGRFLGILSLPNRSMPLDIGLDYVLVKWNDQDDVEYVTLYQLVKPGG